MENSDFDEPTVIQIGEPSEFSSNFGDYSNAGGKFMQKRAENVGKRQEAKREIKAEKRETHVAKKIGRAEGRQEVKGAKQVARQERKTQKVEAKGVKKQARIGMRSQARDARSMGRQATKTGRAGQRMERREMKRPTPTRPQGGNAEDTYVEEPVPTPQGGYVEEGVAEGGYAEEPTQGGYETETSGEVEPMTENGGSYAPSESEEGDYSGDANPNYNNEGYGEPLNDYESEDGGFSDEFDEEFAGANGASSFLVRPRRPHSRGYARAHTKVSPNARFSQNRIVVPSERKSNFDSNEDPRAGLIALSDNDDYDAPEDTVVNLEPTSSFDGGKMSKTTMALLGVVVLVGLGIYVSTKKK